MGVLHMSAMDNPETLWFRFCRGISGLLGESSGGIDLLSLLTSKSAGGSSSSLVLRAEEDSHFGME